MNDILKTIQARRTCRSFQAKPLRKEELNTLIDAGLKAPSGGNFQSTHFTIVNNRDILAQINRAVSAYYATLEDEFLRGLSKRENWDFFYGAPNVVLMSYGKGISPVDDMAVASQNMMLAAESLGLASCWISFNGALETPENAARFGELLKGHIPHHAMAFGYREGNAPGPTPVKDGRVNTVA